jgi:signal peptide peptidase SppA
MNPSFRLLSAIYRSAWLLQTDTMDMLLPMVTKLQQGIAPQADLQAVVQAANDITNNDDEYESFPYYLRVIDQKGKVHRIESYSKAPEDSVAQIPVRGIMMAEDRMCGPAGTDTITRMVLSADKSTKIKGIVFDMRTPGGQVLGTEVLANAITNCSKPTVVYANGLLCSAGIWVGSAADRIIAAGKTTEIGSIGTMWSYADLKPYYEKMGVVFHEIKADGSEDKNKDFDLAMKRKYDSLRTQRLNPTNEVFHQAIINNRGLSEAQQAEALTGKVYHAEQAISLGLADAIGTMDDAIAYIYAQNKKKSSSNSTNMFGSKKNTTAFTALLAVAALTDTAAITEDMLTAANEELTAAGSPLKINLASSAQAERNVITSQAIKITSLEDMLNKEQSGKIDPAAHTALQGQVSQLTQERDQLAQERDQLKANNADLTERILSTKGKDATQEGADQTGQQAATKKLNYA